MGPQKDASEFLLAVLTTYLGITWSIVSSECDTFSFSQTFHQPALKPVPKTRLCIESTPLFGRTERMVSTCTTCNEGLTASISQEH